MFCCFRCVSFFVLMASKFLPSCIFQLNLMSTKIPLCTLADKLADTSLAWKLGDILSHKNRLRGAGDRQQINFERLVNHLFCLSSKCDTAISGFSEHGVCYRLRCM